MHRCLRRAEGQTVINKRIKKIEKEKRNRRIVPCEIEVDKNGPNQISNLKVEAAKLCSDSWYKCVTGPPQRIEGQSRMAFSKTK